MRASNFGPRGKGSAWGTGYPRPFTRSSHEQNLIMFLGDCQKAKVNPNFKDEVE